MISSRWLNRRIDQPDILVRVSLEKLGPPTAHTVISGSAAADENPASLPLREGKRLQPGRTGKFAARVLGGIDGKRQLRDWKSREQQNEGWKFAHSISASEANASQTSRKERLGSASQARATHPVIFATAK